MNVRILTPRQWEEGRFALLRFSRRHGDRKHPHAGWRAFVSLKPEDLLAPGTAVAVVYTGGGQPAGVAFAAGYGEDACVAAVHPALRGRGIGRLLLSRLAEEWGRLTCRVPADNPAALSACFGAGLVAVALDGAAAGKPTLRLVRPGTDRPAAGELTGPGPLPAAPAPELASTARR